MSNIVSLILIIASVGAFFGYINPTYSNIKDLIVKNDQYTQDLDTAKTLILDRGNLLAKYNAFDPSDLAHLQTLLPDSIDEVRLIIEFNAIAKTLGLRLRNFSTGTADQTDTNQALGVDTSPYGTYTFTFTTTASYETFIAFLQALEHNLRLTDVVGVTFSAPTANSAYDFTVTINTYWLK